MNYTPSDGKRTVRTPLMRRLFDYVAPRRCAACGFRLSPPEEAVCGVCQMHMPQTMFHLQPYDNQLARLFWGLMPVEKATALFFYELNSNVGRMIHELKYHNHPEVGFALGRLAAAKLAPTGFFDGIDAVVAVPLSRGRQRQRGYNQSLEIARGVADVTGLPVLGGVVRRLSFDKSQTRLSASERKENVAGVFSLVDGSKISGLHILLIDDIITTGATLTSCGTTLMQAGNVKLSLLSLGYSKS